MKEPFVSRLLKYALYAVFILGVAGTVTLPFMLKTYMKILYDAYWLDADYHTFILLFLMCSALLVLWIVLEMILMLRSVPQGPFILRNVQALGRIGFVFLLLAAAFIGKCFVYVTFLTLGCGLLFIGCSLFAFTLSSLFRQAVAFREENDLTI